MSERIAEVVEINLEPHGNADSLSIVNLGGFCVVVNTNAWQGHTKAIYIRPDEVVDTTRPEFAFLANGRQFERVKAKKLRGIWSIGLLIPAPEDSKLGDNFYEELGLQHYEPEMETAKTGGMSVKGPSAWGDISKYDIENGRDLKYRRLFQDGEPVYVSEKIHGANMGVCFDGEKLHVRSRSEWKTNDGNAFWKSLEGIPGVEKFCRENPNFIVYGEVYGMQKKFNYDCKPGEVKFRCFDIMNPQRAYMSYQDFIDTTTQFEIPTIPSLGITTFNYEALIALAEGLSHIGNHIREGIVIKPLVERRDARLGRVFMKIVSNAYLEKN